jgi:hypothetical protein
VVSDPLTQYVAEMAPVYQALGAAAEPTDAQQVAADSVAIAAAPVEPADISKGEVTPIDGAEPTAADHPAHLSLLKIELFAERIPSDFMQELKRLVAEVRGFL